MAELLAKISAKTVGADPSVAKGKDQSIRFPLFKVYGVAKSLVVKKDSDGNLGVGLKGTFQAINVQEGSALFGTVFDAGVCYLPSGIQAAVEDKVEATDAEGVVTNTPTEFALEVFATAAANKIGYTYGATYLTNPSAADPMAKLREQAMSKGAKVELLPGQVVGQVPAITDQSTSAAPQPEATETGAKDKAKA